MHKIEITLTDTEYHALATVAISPDEWAQNAISERARIATIEIVTAATHAAINAGQTVAQSLDEIVLAATTAAEKAAAIPEKTP